MGGRCIHSIFLVHHISGLPFLPAKEVPLALPAAMSAEEKAAKLIAQADKKLTSWFASLTGTKYEDAEVLYSKAANQLKVAKNCAHSSQ